MNLFKKRVQSLDDFIQAVKDKGEKRVQICPEQIVGDSVPFTAVGTIGHFSYILLFTAGNIIYKEKLFQRFGSSCGISDWDKRESVAIESFLIAEQKTEELRTRLPGISVEFILGGVPMDESRLARLHHDAKRYGLKKVIPKSSGAV